MEVKVKFNYLSTTIEFTSNTNEEINKIYDKFVDALNEPLTDEKDKTKATYYIYYYKGHKLGNKGTIGNDKYLRGQKDIIINVQKKLRFIKCPKCVCNDCIVNLDNNLITFYGCKYKHVISNKYDEYIKVQKIEGPELHCSSSNCENTQENYFKGFYKCFTCTETLPSCIPKEEGGGSQYYCKDHIEDPEQHDNHFYVKFDKKNYYCGEHKKAYKNYCFDDKIDLCEDCLSRHTNCRIKGYNAMESNLDKLKESLNLMEKNINGLRLIIESITKRLNDAMRVYKRYQYIAKDIIGKYELFNKDLKNFKILKSLRNLKATNTKMNKELTNIVTEKDQIKIINSLFTINDNLKQSIKIDNIDHSKDNDDDWWDEIAKPDKLKSSTQKGIKSQGGQK